MIEITPEIMGPGIEEEYADAMTAITDLRAALGERPMTNNTPDGRLLLELAWLEQEIKAQRLPIPVDRSYTGTVCYLVGSGELDRIPGVEAALGRLYQVVEGIGILKPRHTPVVISAIEDLWADAQAVWEQLPTKERLMMEDIHAQADLLRRRQWPSKRLPKDLWYVAGTKIDELIPNSYSCINDVEASLFSNWRPHAARKPQLEPPVPGLPVKAPMLPPGLEGKLP